MNIARLTALLAILPLTLLVGCMLLDSSAWTTEDSWYFPPDDLNRDSTPVPKEQFVEVIPAKMDLAEEKLQHASCIEITEDEILEFVEKRIERPIDSKPYLVRAICLNPGTGLFSLNLIDTELHVHHSSLGRRPMPMKRQPLVVFLTTKPDRVYVTCSMSE